MVRIRHSFKHCQYIIMPAIYNDQDAPEHTLLCWQGKPNIHVEIKEDNTMFYFYSEESPYKGVSPFICDPFINRYHWKMPKESVVVFTQGDLICLNGVTPSKESL